MASPSQESTASESSVLDKTPVDSKVDVTTQAVLAWGTGQLSELVLDIHYDPSAATAFFKFRSTVFLKSLKTSLYLLIAPERIQSLTLEDLVEPASNPSGQAQSSNSTSMCLHFTLDTAADLVGPSFVGLTPKNKTAGQILDQLRLAAGALKLSVYISHKLLSKAQLLSLCRAVSQPDCRSTPGQADLKCLYHGKGGKVMCGGSIPVTSDQAPCLPRAVDDNPPSYDEAGLNPPTAGPPQPRNKKRRCDDTDDTTEGTELMVAMEAMCRKLLQEQKSELRNSIVSEMKQYVHEQLQELETRITDQIELQVERYGDKLEDRLAEDLQGLRDEISDQTEDEFYGLRIRLEDFVKEEIQEAEERVVEHIQSRATVHLEFD